jgi:hypothetical protein
MERTMKEMALGIAHGIRKLQENILRVNLLHHHAG